MSWIGVDMHSHLLPGIDDGVGDVETAISFIGELRELGYGAFVCTPHVYDEVHPNTPQTIGDAHKKLSDALAATDLKAPLFASAEYMLGERFPQLLADNELLAQPGGHLLVEMSYIAETKDVSNLLFGIAIKGYAPILAHPERYIFYFANRARLHALKEAGCLFQLNLLSPTGYYGKEVAMAARYLIKQDMYDFIGTDLHHERHLDRIKRYVLSGKAYEELSGLPLRNAGILGG